MLADKKIWVDADATPRPVKEMLYRIAQRKIPISIVFVANQRLHLPKNSKLTMQVVGKGFDVADEWIADHAEPGHLVISADVPLAAAVVEKGAVCVTPHGEVIDANNARSRLAMRDYMETMRESGEIVGSGPKPYSDKDKRKIAGVLDKWLATGRIG